MAPLQILEMFGCIRPQIGPERIISSQQGKLRSGRRSSSECGRRGTSPQREVSRARPKSEKGTARLRFGCDVTLNLNTVFWKCVLVQALTRACVVVSITRDGSGRRDQAALASRML